MAAEKKTDLRVQKTKRAIRETFKEMVSETEASKITVKELTERAMIHRKTFYLHYNSIEELYEDILNELSEEYFNEIDKLDPNAPFTEVNRVFFTFMAGREPYIERLVCSLGYREFADKLFLSMMIHNRARHNPYADHTKEQQNIINTFLVLTSVNIYRRWIYDNKKMPLDELIDLSGQLFMHGISSIEKKKYIHE